MAQLVGASSPTPKGCRFYPRSGHIPGLQVRSLVGVRMGGSWSMFLLHIYVSLSLSLPLSLNQYTYSQVRILFLKLKETGEIYIYIFYVTWYTLNILILLCGTSHIQVSNSHMWPVAGEIPGVSCGAWDSAVLMGSQVILTLLVQGPALK